MTATRTVCMGYYYLLPLLLLIGNVLDNGCVQAFCLVKNSQRITTTPLLRAASEPENTNTSRRDTLRSLLGGAVSMAAWDRGWNMVITTTASPGAIAERVLAFGNKYKIAVASEDLTRWIATQTVAAKTPEIQAWLTAQKRLQAIRKTSVAVTAVVSRTHQTRAVAVAAVHAIGASTNHTTTTACKTVIAENKNNTTHARSSAAALDDNSTQTTSRH